ncbi:MAG TPA: hypothetical protein VGP48_14080 [Stellaceae bacterium]|jgi:hypothetical protein|nr:hypothetical protein [Stellaceae bacterium]
MMPRIPLILAAALLIAAPAATYASPFRAADAKTDRHKAGSGDQGNQDDALQDDPDGMSDAQTFSLVAGQILGAAAACEQINEQRVASATKKAVKMANDAGESEEDIQAAQQHMLDAADTGRDAVKTGNADCDRVQTSFTKLEQIEQQTPDLQSPQDDDE